MDLQTIWGRKTPACPSTITVWSSFYSSEVKMKEEKNWYRCTTREQMVVLIAAGFDYINFRADKYNNGNITYFFERTEKLNRFLEMQQQLGC